MRTLDRRPRRGNFLMIFGGGATAILGFGALAIDISYLRNSQMELQNAVDAAAHAALVAYRTGSDQNESRTVAKTVAAANKVGGRSLSLGDDDIVFGTWDFDGRDFSTAGSFVNAVQVTGRRAEGSSDGPINYFLAPILGHQYGEIGSTAVGAFRFREMVLLLDTTSSFFRDIDNGRDAVIGFLDSVNTNHLPQDKIALGIFAQDSRFVTELTDIDGNYSSIRSLWYGSGDSTNRRCPGTACRYNAGHVGLNICFMDRDGNGVADSTTSLGYATDNCHKQRYIDSAMTIENINCYEGSAYSPSEEGTYHAPPLEDAIDHLLDSGLAGNMKTVVLVSDGRAQCKARDDSSTSGCVSLRQQDAFDQVERAAANNVSIFSVMLCSNCSAAELSTYEAFSTALVAGIGKAYTTADSDQLEDILEEIAESLPVALVR